MKERAIWRRAAGVVAGAAVVAMAGAAAGAAEKVSYYLIELRADSVCSGVIDLSGLTAGEPLTLTVERADDGRLDATWQRTVYHFREADGRLLYKGFENNLSSMHLDSAETVMTLPPAPGTANEGRLTGSGLYADRLRHDLDEHYSARTVGGPKLIMPEGDTLQLTVCTVLHRTLDNRYTPLAQPAAHADSLRLEESLTYYHAAGYALPSLVAHRAVGVNGREALRRTYYCPTALLAHCYDEAEALRASEREKQNRTACPDGQPPALPLTYDVSQDRGDRSLTFTLLSEADAPIDGRFIVSDAAGIAFDAGHCRLMPGERTTMRVDYSRLPESAVCAVAIRADGYAPVEHKFRR